LGTTVTAVWVVLAAIAGIGVLAYISFLAARYFFVPRYPDEIHFTKAADGWRIALVRYRPRAGAPRRDLPVLAVHGLASNRNNLDLTDERSLAQALAADGWDVWLIELRGRGLSTRPRLFSGLRYDWCFDDYVEKDLPGAASAIRAATGASRLHVIGFSTGALASYAWLSSPRRDTHVASLVSLAGPAWFGRTSKTLSGRLIRSLRWMRHRWLMRLLAPISGYVHPSPLQVIYNPENTEGAIQRRAMVNMIANFSRNELLQYSDWILRDVFCSIDRRRDYRAELGQITTPVLFLAGPRDALAPPDAVKATYEAVGSTDKQFRVCSRAQGLRVNYGHFDLVIGREAPSEIFPLISSWLAAHDGAVMTADAQATTSATTTNPTT
jgi:pimeloyl-ACP methyl ester carboxylesterase